MLRNISHNSNIKPRLLATFSIRSFSSDSPSHNESSSSKIQQLMRTKPLSTTSVFADAEEAGAATANTKILDPKQPFGIEVIAKEIKLRKGKQTLEISFSTGEKFTYAAEYLRVESPSAEVQGHGPSGEKKLVYGKKFVTITGIEPVGNYAIRLLFNDNHGTGIYSWKYLYTLAKRKFTLQKRYIQALREAKRSRYPYGHKPTGGNSTQSNEKK